MKQWPWNDQGWYETDDAQRCRDEAMKACREGRVAILLKNWLQAERRPQGDLAELLGITKSAVSRLLNQPGHRGPRKKITFARLGFLLMDERARYLVAHHLKVVTPQDYWQDYPMCAAGQHPCVPCHLEA